MSGFTKIYGSVLLQSSLWLFEEPMTKLVWFTFLAMADAEGNVNSSVRKVAKLIGIDAKICGESITVLESPDPDSSNKDHEGRRVLRTDCGWWIVSHSKYRDCRSDKQLRNADYMKNYRAKKSTNVTCKKSGLPKTTNGQKQITDPDPNLTTATATLKDHNPPPRARGSQIRGGGDSDLNSERPNAGTECNNSETFDGLTDTEPSRKPKRVRSQPQAIVRFDSQSSKTPDNNVQFTTGDNRTISGSTNSENLSSRAQAVIDNPLDGRYTRASLWPEVLEIAKAWSFGTRAPKMLDDIGRDSNLRSILEAFAMGYSVEDLAKAGAEAKRSEYFKKLNRPGPSCFTPTVLSRLMDDYKGGVKQKPGARQTQTGYDPFEKCRAAGTMK